VRYNITSILFLSGLSKNEFEESCVRKSFTIILDEILNFPKVRITHPQSLSTRWPNRELQSQQTQVVGMMQTEVYFAKPRYRRNVFHLMGDKEGQSPIVQRSLDPNIPTSQFLTLGAQTRVNS